MKHLKMDSMLCYCNQKNVNGFYENIDGFCFYLFTTKSFGDDQ